jgi:hypothetical protein
VRWRQHSGAAIAFVVLAIAFTWPLAPNLDRVVATPGDPLLNIYILDWDWWGTFHQPLSLYQAPAFYPAKWSLAFSENMYAIAVLLFPLRAAGVGAVSAYNMAMLAGFALSGFGAYVFGRRLTGSFTAGMAAGVFYAFVPFRFIHLVHIQHVWGGWLPLLLAALLAYHERPTWKRGWIVAAIFVLNALTNIHYLFFGAFAAGVTALLLIRREQWRELAVPMLAALLFLVPFLAPYAIAAKLYGMERGAEEVLRYSAVPRDWLPGAATDPERQLWPGALSVIVGLLAFVVARRERAKLSLAVLWIAIGFAGSHGLNFVFHEFLYGAVPGFRAIRAAARWAVIAYIGQAILIALFTAAIARRYRWAVPVAFALSLWSAPVLWFVIDPHTPPVYTWLAMQDVNAIAELPMDVFSSDFEYLLHATVHRKKFVNAIWGRDEFPRLSRALTDEYVDALRRVHVELVIVHSDRYGGEDAARMRDWLGRELSRGRLRYVAHFAAKTGADWVFRVVESSSHPVVERNPFPHELGVFLAGGANCVSSVAGALVFPPGAHEYRGRAEFYGWTFSPNGIAKVDLLFNNRRVRYPARLSRLRDGRCPGPPAVRYELVFPSRPENVREKTDVQVEVTDAKGATAVFEDRWISWK